MATSSPFLTARLTPVMVFSFSSLFHFPVTLSKETVALASSFFSSASLVMEALLLSSITRNSWILLTETDDSPT